MARTLYGTQFGMTGWGGVTDSDGQWQNLSSWFEDGFGVTQADGIPEDGDTVFTDGTLTVGPVNPVSLFSFDNTAQQSTDSMDYTNVFVTTNLNFIGIWITDLPETVNATFDNASTNEGAIDGGTVNFFNGSVNTGTINGGVLTFDQSANTGNITGGEITFVTSSSYNSCSSISNATVIYDADAFTDSIFQGVIPYLLVGTDTIISVDNGETFFYAPSRAPTKALFNLVSPVATPVTS